MSWLRFHMMARPTHFNFLHSARKLYQQYIVDEFERHQTSDMGWMVHSKKKLRAEVYKGVQDVTRSNSVENSGRATTLSATYSCSDRWYNTKYMDTMAIVRTKGKPTCFITMTMDPKCPEVMAQLEPGQTPYDRPAILCRVFDLREKNHLDCIARGNCFEQCNV